LRQSVAWRLSSSALHGNDDRHTLLDVEDILVGRSVRAHFLFLDVTVEVEHENAIKILTEMASQVEECRVVEVAMVGDEAEHALTVLLDQMLRHSDKLDVVV